MKLKSAFSAAAMLLAAALFTACSSAGSSGQSTSAAAAAVSETSAAAETSAATETDKAAETQAESTVSSAGAISSTDSSSPSPQSSSTTVETADAPSADTAPADQNKNASDSVSIRVGAMSGPTAMGMVKLMSDSEAGLTSNTYEFADLATEASAFVTPIVKGELDIAAVPSNLASVLYNKTEGGVQVLAVNVLGVLNLVERGDSLNSIKDLKGHTIYATGQSAVPEYIIRYLLTANGIDPDQDLDIHWCADTTEALSYLKEDEHSAAILPQPFATAAAAQIEDLRIVQDLNDAWAELNTGCEITTGVIVVRTAFAEEHPDLIKNFLAEYAQSVAYTSSDPAGCAKLIEKYGIVAKAPLAEKALPKCHIVCLTGSDMKSALSGFLQILFDQEPEAVGGAMPDDNFYYGN